jgi:FMN-dependent NADH-azoreductase
MSKLLHIQASPRNERSASAVVAKRFLEVFRARRPDVTIETMDVWETPLPEFGIDMIEAKFAVVRRQPHTPAQREAWQTVTRIAQHFLSADYYLFSVPLWNLSVPYKLKHYLDILVQPGLTFSYSPEGFKGLVNGKKGVAIYARGSEQNGNGNFHDYQMAFMRDLLGFIGLQDLGEIVVAPTAVAPNSWQLAVDAAMPKTEELAAAI